MPTSQAVTAKNAMTTPNREANAAMMRLANPAMTKAPVWKARRVEPARAAQAADGNWGSLRHA